MDRGKVLDICQRPYFVSHLSPLFSPANKRGYKRGKKSKEKGHRKFFPQEHHFSHICIKRQADPDTQSTDTGLLSQAKQSVLELIHCGQSQEQDATLLQPFLALLGMETSLPR